VLFHGATLADLKRVDGPLIGINASDPGYGVRISFVSSTASPPASVGSDEYVALAAVLAMLVAVFLFLTGPLAYMPEVVLYLARSPEAAGLPGYLGPT